MTGDAPTRQMRPKRLPPSGWVWLRRGTVLLLLAGIVGIGTWQQRKPLPPGVNVATTWTPVPVADVRLLIDTTTADAFGRRIMEQQIFDESLRLVREAREFIVLDMFLFNAHRGTLSAASSDNADSPRPLSRELRDTLIDAVRATPALQVLLITDPINDLYGSVPSADFALLAAAGVEIVRTDLDQLRDSNPLYSSLWRAAVGWWSGDAQGHGWLPNPLDNEGEAVTLRSWARLLNFKANHRKVLIADDGRGGLVGIVSSANIHDASSAHSNLALELRGPALLPLLASELAIARFSGGRIAAAANEVLNRSPDAPAAGAGPQVFVRTLTEAAILNAVLQRLGTARAGDQIDCAMFYLSERRVIDALIAAADRGAEVRVLLDPNRDAFGRQKGGLPNRPVAAELVSRSDGAIKLRWYRTRGEQFHAKLMVVRSGDRAWMTTGSANFTRRNLRNFNLEANLAVEGSLEAPVFVQAQRYFETIWNNRGPTGVEYTADFGTYADPAQLSYWAYRLMEATGLSTF